MDNGGEFVSKEFSQFCEVNGIYQQFIVPYIPKQNGVVEWKNKFLVESAQSMLSHAKLSDGFWGEAIFTTYFIQRKFPH
jgi:transposase InsO family protein